MQEVSESTGNQATAEPFLVYFKYDHLPEHLQKVSTHFSALAYNMVNVLPRSAERTVMLRKLLEAKDCAVRACLDAQGGR